MSDHFRAKKYDVFVSYKRLNGDVCAIVEERLRNEGYEPFVDSKGLQAGSDWQEQLRDRILECNVTIGLWSKEAKAEPDEVMFELNHAYGVKRLLGVRLDGAHPPKKLAKDNWLDFTGWEDPQKREAQLDQIIEEVKRMGAEPKLQIIDRGDVEQSIPVHRGELPPPPKKLIGRDAELQMLRDAWADKGVHAVVLYALGGAGKSAILHTFLNDLLYRGDQRVQRIYGWSAYSQGSGADKRTDAGAFISKALADFGYDGPPIKDSMDRARMLASLVQRERTLLLLDGLEPLQSPPRENEGRFKDKPLAELIKILADQNPGLLVITTRQEVTELDGKGALVINHPLDGLSPSAGANLLVHLGAEGRQKDLEKAVEAVDGHALSVTLLGTYIAEVCGRDIRQHSQLNFGDIIMTDEETELAAIDKTIIPAKRAQKVMQGYLKRFEDLQNGGTPEYALLHLLGLFDRPADGDAVNVLLAERIPGLTDALFVEVETNRGFLGFGKKQQIRDLTSGERVVRLRAAKRRLRKLQLISQAADKDPNGLDAHPVVRAYFAERLKDTAPEAAKIAHDRLYNHYAAQAPDLPDTLEEMQPLFHAIAHGVAAGHVQEVFDEVYWRRIQRSNEAYITRVLGAFGPRLAASSHFFDPPWTTPHPDLTPGDQAWVLSSAAFALTSLGRLVESVEPRRASLERYIASKDWKNAAVVGGTQCETLLTLGRVNEALPIAQTALEHAKEFGDKQQIEINFTYMANAQLAAGALDDSLASFQQAEKLQAEHRPDLEGLVSLWGYGYGDLLLERGEIDDALRRGQYILAMAESYKGYGPYFQDSGYAHLLIGRAQHALNQPEALTSLDAAVDGLRKAGVEDELPKALLARAAWYRDQAAAGDTTAIAMAHQDLNEVEEIAGDEMGMYLVDLALERARLALDVPAAFDDPLTTARTNTDAAADLIAKTGYHRRDGELAELQTRLAKF